MKRATYEDVLNAPENKVAEILDGELIFVHDAFPELLNLQSVAGQAKPYQVRQLLHLVERHNLVLEDADE